MSADTVLLGDRVFCRYRLSSVGKALVDSLDQAPEQVRVAPGELAPALVQCMLGLAVGQRARFELAAGEAFGPRQEALIQCLPRAEFAPSQELAVGHSAEFVLPNGETLIGTLLAIDADAVTVDFNHPFAELPIVFEVEIVAIERDGS